MRNKKILPGIMLVPGFFFATGAMGQVVWQTVDSLYQPLPPTVHVYKTTSLLDGKPNIAYYLEADMQDHGLVFTTDTSRKRRLTPTQYYEKGNKPLLVVNTTFFSFTTNESLNLVVKDKKTVAMSPDGIALKGKDTLKYFHTLSSAIALLIRAPRISVGCSPAGRKRRCGFHHFLCIGQTPCRKYPWILSINIRCLYRDIRRRVPHFPAGVCKQPWEAGRC